MSYLITKKPAFKAFAITVALCTVFQLWMPSAVFALTSGPSQPEMNGFQPVGTNNMVDLFTGDFSYNIPLLNVPGIDGGYPVNLGYQSTVGLEQEASWVGLGWTVNPGVINRQMRGVPDEFKGDKIIKKRHTRPDWTATVPLTANLIDEVFGAEIKKAVPIGATFAPYFNSNNGFGHRIGLGASVVPAEGKSGWGGGLQATYDSNSGAAITPSLSYTHTNIKEAEYYNGHTGSIGATFHSRQGMQDVFLSHEMSRYESRVNGRNDDGSASGLSGQRTGASMGSGVSFAYTPGLPTIDWPMNTTNFSVDVKTGYDFGGATKDLDVGVDFSITEQATSSLHLPAFGYMNEQYATSSRDMMDFNLMQQGVLKEKPDVIPMANHTYDVFHVNSQSASGNFRLYRSDFGMLHNPSFSSVGVGEGFNIEGDGGTNSTKGGAGASVWANSSYSGPWQSGQAALDSLRFKAQDLDSTTNPNFVATPDYVPAYFKRTGEFSGYASEGISSFDDDVVRMKMGLSMQQLTRKPVARFNNDAASESGEAFTDVVREERCAAPSQFSTLTKEQAASLPSNAYINSAPDHHLAEITVLDITGRRSVFGLPSYNVLQRDVSFSVEHDTSTGQSSDWIGPYAKFTKYDEADDSEENRKGYQQLFASNELPPYAHSFLLTKVLSNDYVDLTDNGPSEDDFGGYVLFKYDRAYSDFEWRIPLSDEDNTASLDQRHLSDQTDDIATYSYGQKEIHYLDTIHTKTHFAVFYTSDRHDALGALDADGGIDTNRPLQKLDSIALFAKAEGLATGTPLKTVHFEYNYSLCADVPNNSGQSVDKYGNTGAAPGDNINADKGKLTLKKLWFTYRGLKSKGALSPYLFTYAEASTPQNPAYGFHQTDRWGNYQPDSAAVFPHISNAENPYTSQYTDYNGDGSYNAVDDSLRNSHASAWCLRQINLPSGGVLNVAYEADDYAFVQNKCAMQMVRIIGTGDENGMHIGSKLGEITKDDNRIYFELPQPIPFSDSTAALARMLNGLDNIYYKAYTQLRKKEQPGLAARSMAYGYVDGYLQRDKSEAGFLGTSKVFIDGENHYTAAYISVEQVNVSDAGTHQGKTHPIRKAALQYLQLQRSDLERRDDIGIASIADAAPIGPGNLFKMIVEGVSFRLGYYKTAILRGFAKRIDLDSDSRPSYLRLNTAFNQKYGGGHRVASITISDGWQSLQNNNSNYGSRTYGQEYRYTLENGNTSGVAAYEPMVGGEENPFRQPIFFRPDKLLARAKTQFIEEPLAESYFPGAMVGYSRVIVRPIDQQQAVGGLATYSHTGFTETLFYTAKDYPVQTRHTEVETDHFNPRFFFTPLLGKQTRKHFGYSQGVIVELNDMHGKKRREATYAYTPLERQRNIVTATEYHYKSEHPYTEGSVNKLSNQVTVQTADGSMQERTMGKTVEVFGYQNENRAQFDNIGLNGQGHLLGFVTPVLTAFPTWDRTVTTNRVVSVTKVINRTGILEKVVSTYEGSNVPSEHMVYDAETGQPIVSRTKNEFGKWVYSYAQPAYWHYPGMGGAWQNIGALVTSSEMSMLTPGDELLDPVGERWWWDGTNFTNEDNTTTVSAPYASETWTIVRSGYRNQQAVMAGGKATQIGNGSSGSNISGNFQIDLTYVDSDGSTANYTGTNSACDGITYNYTMVLATDSCSNPNQQLNITNTTTECSFEVQLPSTISSVTDVQSIEFELTSDDGFCSDYYYLPLANVQTSSGTVKGGLFDYDAGCMFQCGSNLVLQANASTFNHQWPYDLADAGATITTTDTTNNPYRYGVRGIWRNSSSYTYLADREQTAKANYGTNIGIDGHFSYEPFTWDNVSANTGWTRANTVTQYSPFGFELENKDARGIYSTALYGHNNTTVTAVANNARYHELAYDGFEDYPGTYASSDTRGHIKFNAGTLSSTPHTGEQSLKINANSSASFTATINTPAAGEFYPLASKRYYLCAWVRGEQTTLEVTTGGQTVSVSPDLNHAPIEGWYRLQLPHTAAASGSYQIRVVAGSSEDAYIDDIRLFPEAGRVKTYVYDPDNLWLTAELDGRNYATFYNYDEEGGVTQVKKETVHGVRTIQMTRSNVSQKGGVQ